MDLLTVLQNAQSPDHAIRNQAEVFLQQAVEAQYGPFVLALCAEFGIEGRPEMSRQLAGLYLKNLIAGNDDAIIEEKVGRWTACDPAHKEQIRTLFLQALQSPVPVVRRTAAQVLAAFGSVDVPTSSWPALIPSLYTNVTNPAVPDGIRISTLEALGYMCDQMEPAEVAKDVTNQILSAIIDGLRADRPMDVRQAAIVALLNSLDFTEANFEVEAERDAVMGKIVEACQSADPKTRSTAYDCFAKIAELFYDKLPRYIEAIFLYTTTAIKSDAETGLNAMEFWSTLCDIETQLEIDDEDKEEGDAPECLKIVSQAATALVPILLETLTKQSDDIDDDESWNIAMAGATCLDLVAQTIGDPAVDLTIPFIQANIQNPNWRLKEASIMAFGSIVDGPSTEKLTPIVSAAIPVLVGCMQDPSELVRDTSAWTIGRICEFQKESLRPESIEPMVGALAAILDDPHLKVVSQACFAVHNLAEACKDENEAPSNILSSFMPQMLGKLFGVTLRQHGDAESLVNLRTSAFEAIMMMIENCAADMLPVVLQVLQQGFTLLEQTLAPQADTGERTTALSTLCSMVHVCVNKLPETAVDVGVADRAMMLLLQVFTSSRGAAAHSDAFMAIGYLAGKRGKDFVRYMPHLVPILIQGLKNVDEPQVCRTAVGLVGDLCRALEDELKPHCDDIMRHLIELLQSPVLDKEVKPDVISSFADIAMAIEGDFDRYASIILELLRQAGEVEVPADDEELQDYVTTLYISILEAYSGVLQGLKDSGKQDALLASLDQIAQFLQRSSAGEDRPSEVLKAAVGLIGDLAQTFGKRVQQLFASPVITQIVQNGLGDEDENVQRLSSWAQQEIVKTRGF